jgi:hypothetical protein
MPVHENNAPKLSLKPRVLPLQYHLLHQALFFWSRGGAPRVPLCGTGPLPHVAVWRCSASVKPLFGHSQSCVGGWRVPPGGSCGGSLYSVLKSCYAPPTRLGPVPRVAGSRP